MKEERSRLRYEVEKRHRQGKSQRRISQVLGIARKTVRKILIELDQRREHGESALERELPKPRTPKASKLDRFVKDIEAWLEQYPDLKATRLLEMLQEKGFAGRYTIVREYLKEYKAKSKDCARPKAYQIVETLPGQQFQFDWSPYILNKELGLKVQVWSCILSWSRGLFMQGEDNTRQSTILRNLKKSFEAFGGVPDQAVTDTMPGVVDRWECNIAIINVRFVDFAAYYGFTVNIAPRGDPEYKGKVERRFRYLMGSLHNGRTFYSIEQFRETLVWWIRNKAMERPHRVTKEPISQMFQKEVPFLHPLPAHPYDTRDVVFRLVDESAYVSYETNFYKVPEEHVGQMIYVCVDEKKLEIFDNGVHKLAEHERLPDGAGQRVGQTTKKLRYDVTLLLQRLGAWGEIAEAFASRLQARKRYVGPELHFILQLQLTWSAEDIVQAMKHALDYDAVDSKVLERILQVRFSPRTLDEQVATSTRSAINQTMQGHPVQCRDLSSYDSLTKGDKKDDPQ